MFQRIWYLALTLLVLPTLVAQADELKTRVEVNTRLGTDRHIGMTELWHPLSQDYGRVLYTDMRLMGDSDSNSEFNLGLGHRHITNMGEGIVGVHGWFDRRRTERGSVFHQITAGYEYFTVNNDLRINTYFPFDEEEKYTIPVASAGSVYVGGTGIFYDTNGLLVERPMQGADIEFGHQFKVPIAPETGFRASAGAFVFSANDVETVRGGRIKFSADVTSDFQVGARFESDNARGSQGFVEATLRFPFGAKAANETLAIRNRLDESPERDIDIISGSAVLDPGVAKPVVSTLSGEAQRIFYVDNTAAAGGDGSIERPFNMLADANAALGKAGDLIYVFNGDGTSTNYDTHVELLMDGQGLIGEGSALTYDGGRFSAGGIDFTGTTLIAAGARPTITNTLGTFGTGWGGGVYVNADDVLLSGFVVDGALYDGIDINNSSNTTITNVETNNGDTYGMWVEASDGQTRSFTLDGFSSSGNNGHGFEIGAYGVGTVWDGLTFNNITISDSVRGLFVAAYNGGVARNISITNSSITNQSAEAFVFNTNDGGLGGGIENITLDNLYSQVAFNGLTLQNAGSAYIHNVTANNLEITQSTAAGIDIRANGTSAIEDVTLTNIDSNGGTGGNSNGILFRGSGTVRDISISDSNLSGNAASGITMSTVHVSNMTINNVIANNNVSGFNIDTANGSTRSNINISNYTATNNTQNGIRLATNAGGTINGMSITSSTFSNNATGINIGGNGSISNIDIIDTVNNNNTGTGIQLNAAVGASLSAIDFTNTTANQNINGVNITGAGAVSNVTFNTITTNQNQNGFAINSGALGTRNNISITNLTATSNTTDGVRILSGLNNTVTNVTFTDSTITGNTVAGFRISGSSNGSITGLNVSNSNISNNTGTGVYLNTANTSVFSGQFAEVTATANGTNGFYFDDDSTGAYTVDLGGGALGSLGNNRIFGNTGTELRVDMDGAQLKAENNWWGNVLGLLAGERTLEVASTVDSDPFLAADPNP